MSRNGNASTEGVHKTHRKRGRVPTSCAECRRLKLRCDNNVPCEKCVSRGCGSICPEGTLTAGKGNRLILANTEELHDQIERLCTRIRELENALRTLQKSVSSDPHPLLQDPGFLQPMVPQLSSTATSSSSHNSTPTPHVESHPTSTEDESSLDAFGTLALGHGGESTFFGQTARTEYLISAPSILQSRTNAPTRFSKRFTDPVLLGPDVSGDGVGEVLLRSLPPLPEAIHLCEVYQVHGKYLYTPIPREELLDEILASVYRAESFDVDQCHHVMAVLFGVFSLGALFDTDRQSFSPESQEYCFLARTALAYNAQVTPLSITGYMLVAQYLFFGDCDFTNSNLAWMYIGHAVRLGHSIGLHVDSFRWKLSQENVQHRRRLFWQLFVCDTWFSFCFGRPPIITTTHIDCPFPRDSEDVIADGDKQISFHSWTRRYTMLLRSIISTAFGAKQPTYPVIISLDRKIRDFPIPAHWRPVSEDAEGHAPIVPLELNMHRWLCMSSKEMTLLSLHRPYFTQALQEMPADLARHRYIPSVIAIYRSAWRIIEGMQITWRRIPQVFVRFSLAWSQGLAAAIVMCLLVTRAPSSNMTTSALAELDAVLKLFENGALHSRAVVKFLDPVRNLHRMAHGSMDQTESHNTTAISTSELDRLSGKTHLLADTARDGDSRPSGSITHTPSPEPQGHIPDLLDFLPEANSNSMHPTIVQDIKSFDMGVSAFNDFLLDFPTVSSVSQLSVPDLRSPDISSYTMPNYSMCHTNAGFEQHLPAPPVLDATWQSFVEQLGF